MLALLTDIGAALIPGVPAPGSARVLLEGRKITRTAFQRLQKLAFAASVGRKYHAARSIELWNTGHIGATKLLTGSGSKTFSH